MPINAEYRGPGELPEIIPVFPLPGALLLPRGQMPLNIFEPRYLSMVDDSVFVNLQSKAPGTAHANQCRISRTW